MFSISSNVTVAFVLIASIEFLTRIPSGDAVICSADDYCPRGWSVLRKANYDATTCDPMTRIKCEQPYQCVHSHCGMSFCCVDKDRLKKWKEYKEIGEDYDDGGDSREEL